MRKRVNDHRRMWKYVIFGFLTLGIYMIYNDWTMINDMNTACGYVENNDTSRKSPHYLLRWLLCIVTFGIYNYIWFYQQGNRLKHVGEKYGVEIDEKGSTYLLWMLLGVLLFGLGPWIAIYFMICNCNKVCAAYNAQIDKAVAIDGPSEDSGVFLPGNTGDGTLYPPEDGGTVKIRPKGVLKFISGEYAGAEITLLDGEEIVLGRNSSMSQLVFKSADISRRHCSIRYMANEGYFYITDFSTVGTILNNSVKLEKNVIKKCTVGTTVSLGDGNNRFILQAKD